MHVTLTPLEQLPSRHDGFMLAGGLTALAGRRGSTGHAHCP